MELNLGCGQLSDDEFITAFEACRLEPAKFHHSDHVRLAWIYAGRCCAVEAEQKLLNGIRRFATSAGVPEKFQYTSTVAWARLVSNSRKKSGSGTTFEDWIVRYPEFLDRRLLDNYFLKGKLESEPARTSWVEPDLMPLD